jgi:phosphatidylserine/phosphatidylglycerophosphate/cardiolipin synthase-like enzyme
VTQVAADIPRFGALTGQSVSTLLFEWLSRPSLQEAVLVSFAFDPDFKWALGSAAAERLAVAMERAANSADLTVIVASNVVEEPTDAGTRRRVVLSRLARAGATVLHHATLHAKVYLFEEEGRCCWVVGSSNMTGGGLSKNTEVNLRGFHEADFAAVRRAVQHLVAESQPYTPEEATDD